MVQCSADPNPNSPACTYMGLAILCFVLCGFLGVLLLLVKNQKNLEKTKKKQPKSYLDQLPHGFVFFVSFGFLEVFATLSKTQKTTKTWGELV